MAAECWDRAVEQQPREAIEAEKRRKFLAVAQRAVARSRFYSEKWGRAKVRVGEGLALADLPCTDRDELHGFLEARLGEALCVPRSACTLFGYTGSQGITYSGRPLRLLLSQRDLRTHADSVARGLFGIGVRPGERVYLGEDPRLNPMYVYLTQGVARLSAQGMQHGTWRSQRTVDYVMALIPPHHLFLTPSFALFLQEMVAQRSLRLPLRTISGWGEPGYSLPSFRGKVEEAWSKVSQHPVKAYDCYGLMEAGPLAFACPAQEGLHGFEDRFIYEVIDPRTGQALPPGTPGELVVTSLEAEVLPLIRYRTGDVTTVADGPCPCGRTHLRLQGILGRTTEAVEVGGRPIWPGRVRDALARLGQGDNFRIVQGPGEALQVHLGGEPQDGGLESRLADALGVRAQVAWKGKELPRYLHRGVFVLDGVRDQRLHDAARAQAKQEGLG